MKKTITLLAMLTVLAMTLSMMAVSAFAATEIAGSNTITFDKYLTMDANANVPDAAFGFTIESGAPVAAVTTGTKAPAVMAGPAGALLTYGETTAATVTVDFKPGDTTYHIAQGDDTVTLATGEKYAKEVVTVDLTGVTFTQPGIYRCNITETATNDGVSNDSVATRYLDIYIESNDTGDLEISGSILHNTTEVMGALGGVYTAKDGGFTSGYTTYDLTFSKDITGNQGFRSKYFTFTVAITGADANTKYTVDLNHASANDGNNHNNPTELIADENGAVTGTFYLKDDQSVTIYGLTAVTKYTISENAEDYTPSYKLDSGNQVDGNSTPENVAMGESDHTAAFTNYRNGVVPTGILLDAAPYAIVVLLAAAAVVLMISKKRRSTAR